MQPTGRPPRPRPPRRYTPEEIAELRALIQGNPKSSRTVGGYAALIAAIATLIAALASVAFDVWDRLSN